MPTRKKKAVKWDDLLRQYSRDGALIPPEQVNAWMQTFVNGATSELERLAVAHQDGKLSRPEWAIQHAEVMRNLHRAAATVANGGKAQMTAREWGKVGATLRREYGYFNNFVNELDNLPEGTKLGAGFVARAKSYARAGYSTYENSVRQREQAAGRESERLVLGPAEHCPDCLGDAAQGAVPIGTLREIGARQCLHNCRCHFEYGGGQLVDQTPRVTVRYGRGAKKALADLFGRAVSDDEVAQLGGAIGGATVEVKDFTGKVLVKVFHPHIKDMRRFIEKDAGGKLFLNNMVFRTAAGAPKGIGLRAFMTQVGAAKRAGIKYLSTYAAGEPSDPVYNGYYTWARFGYNAKLEQPELDGLSNSLKSAKTLNELMMLSGGPEWWKANGSHRHMRFDLSDDAVSMRVFRNYIRERKARG